MKLVQYDPALHQDVWDKFANQYGTFFHLSAWLDVIKATYRFQPEYHFWEQDGSVVGIFPAFLVKRPFAGTALISNPFSVSCGPLFADHLSGHSPEVFASIENIAREAKADYIELRDISDLPAHWQGQQYFANFALELSPNHEDNLQHIPNRQRAIIRKADAQGLTLIHHQDLKRFHRIYARSLRNLGTPIYPLRYFKALQTFFSDQIHMVSVHHQNQDLTTVLCFTHNGKLMPYYGGGIHEARQANSFPWMYWQLMKFGVDNGLPTFDFGRSPIGSGAFQFKKNLGFASREMNYGFLSLDGGIPDFSPESGLVQHLTSIWRHVPLPLANLVGPLGAVYAV